MSQPSLFDAPASRSSDPVTTRLAAERVAPVAATHRALALKAFVEAGDDGLTGEELADATGIPYETIGPRRPSLARNGLVEVRHDVQGKTIRRLNRNGSPCEVWYATDAAVGALRATRTAA